MSPSKSPAPNWPPSVCFRIIVKGASALLTATLLITGLAIMTSLFPDLIRKDW